MLPAAVQITEILNSYTSRPHGIPGAVFVAIKKDGTVLYEGASGPLGLNHKDQQMEIDTMFAIHSSTKIVTSTAAMQLVEQGKLHLYDFVEKYAPEFSKIKILEGFDSDGNPIYKETKTKATIRQLLIHACGVGADPFNPLISQYHDKYNVPRLITKSKACLDVPLVSEPGSQWEYGNGVDWVGLIIQNITGQTLGEYFQQNIFTPLGMKSTNFDISAESLPRFVFLHHRMPDGSLIESQQIVPHTETPEFHIGGSGLNTTAPDLARVLQALTNDGVSSNGTRILKKETVDLMFANQTTPLGISLEKAELGTAIPGLVTPGVIAPEYPKSWSFAGLRLEKEFKTGRAAGSVWWGGIANSYWWMDRNKGVAGVFMAQMLPFFDPETMACWHECEQKIYEALTS